MANPMTLDQFGQHVKSKHPEYSDMGDRDLAQRVLAKYPQYHDMVQSHLSPQNLAEVKAHNSQPTQLEQQNGGLLRQFAGRMANYLPAAGGLLGGAAGEGLLSIPGAAAGGGLGETLRQVIRERLNLDPKMTPKQAATGIATNAAEQGAMEGGAQVIGAAGRAVAPKLAEVALAPGKRLLKSLPENVQAIGKTVLDNTKGFRPATITKELDSQISTANQGLEKSLADADQTGVKIPLTPARQEIAGEMGSALRKNSPDYIHDVGKVQDQLAYKHGPDGKPVMREMSPATKTGAGFTPVQVPTPAKMQPVALPDAVPPTQARSLRQGLDLTIGNWNPESQSAIAPLQERVRGAIASGIHSAVPESAQYDRAMTNLIPARDAAWNVSYNPELTRSIFNRVARPTGALAGAGFGAYEGGKEYGTPGAVAGGLAGLVVPELLSSPTGQMFMARGAADPRTLQMTRGLMRVPQLLMSDQRPK